MNAKIEKLKETVRKAMGSHCLGIVDRSELNGQLAFVTDEDDKGESVHGEWTDLVTDSVKVAGMSHVPVMPFATNGKLMYVVAGLKRNA
jgi:hypothetical protein